MGNQCIADDTMGREYKVKQLSHVSQGEPGMPSDLSVGLDAVDKAYDYIEHFQQVEKVPKLHPTVQQI